MSAPELSNPPAVAKPLGPYSHVAKITAGSAVLYFAGQVGNRPDGSVPVGIEEQAQEAFANVVRLLESEGLAPAHIAKLTIYLVHGQDRMAIRGAWQKHLRGAQPASTLIFVPQLAEPRYLIEIDCIAGR